MDIVKGLVRTTSFWVFIVVGVLGGIGAIYPLPFLGVIIAALTILGVSLQGAETVRAQKELDRKHTSVLQEIEQARGEAAQQHTEAMQEIEQARREAAIQYAEAAQEIKKARDEARAENILLEAKKFATSLMDKDERVNKAVALCPDFKQSEWRQLGIEMSAAVIGNVDYVKWQSMKAAGYIFEPPLFQLPLEEEERTIFTDHAISYLTETVLNPAIPDAQGLLYLACMYGCRNQYDEMMEVLDKASQISQIVQVMKDQYRERPMMLILVGACGSDQTKIDRLRETLNLPRTTEQFFCDYITKEYPLKSGYPRGDFIKWVAVRRPDAPGISGSTVIMISPVYPSDAGTAYAYSLRPDGRQEEIVPVDKKVPIEELYRILSSLFILFCPID